MFQSLPNFCQPYLHPCAILLHLNNIPTAIEPIYSSPTNNINKQNYDDYFSILSYNCSIGGDYNANHYSWGCCTNNPRSLVLNSTFINLKGYYIHTSPRPTYWPTSLHIKNPIYSISLFPTRHPTYSLQLEIYWNLSRITHTFY